jgi:DNA processing protein
VQSQRQVRRRLQRRRTQVWLSDRADYPIVDDLPSRPAVLLGEGSNHEQLKGPRVAIVGTRSATPHGLADARELGNYLAAAGVVVISGLAIGIDAAAHEGVLEAGGVAIGVVATGLDVVYPRRHELLYQRVRNSGVIISEQGFGVGPRRGLFPIRNRIIAALADVVIVMEATIKGGARITAQYALEYGRTVMAVPGSRRNAAAAGTNALIADGAHPLIEWSDVLLALGLSSATSARALSPDRPPPSKAGRALLLALGGEAATTDQLISRSGLTVSATALALRELERHHWVVRAQGAIWPQ